MNRTSQKLLLPILIIGDRPGELRQYLGSQNRVFIEATGLVEGVNRLKFGSFVTILCHWDAIRNVPGDASVCQIIADINRLGLPLLIHSSKLAVGLRFQQWHGFYFYHFRTDLASRMLPKLERLALQLAVHNYPNSLAATRNRFASLDPESGWSLSPPAPHFRFGQKLDENFTEIDSSPRLLAE